MYIYSQCVVLTMARRWGLPKRADVVSSAPMTYGIIIYFIRWQKAISLVLGVALIISLGRCAATEIPQSGSAGSYSTLKTQRPSLILLPLSVFPCIHLRSPCCNLIDVHEFREIYTVANITPNIVKEPLPFSDQGSNNPKGRSTRPLFLSFAPAQSEQTKPHSPL